MLDSQSGQWGSLPNMSESRRGAAVATALGSVFVFGGWNGQAFLASSEEFAPAPPARHMPRGRRLHRRAHPRDRRLGLGPAPAHSGPGCSGARLGGWARASAPPRQAAVLGGRIYPMGGFDGARHLDTVEEYDISRGTWRVSGAMREERSSLAAVAIGSSLVALGGFDGREGTRLSTAEQMRRPKANKIGAGAGGKGGKDGASGAASAAGEGRWRHINGLNHARAGHAAVVVP
ncbi:hypothetical protein T484DRAFT_1886117, partial [Baffinella frigidus]